MITTLATAVSSDNYNSPQAGPVATWLAPSLKAQIKFYFFSSLDFFLNLHALAFDLRDIQMR